MMLFLDRLVAGTKLGRGIRAVAEDAPTAALMGIDIDKTISRTFVIGGALAGAAGFLFGTAFSFSNTIGFNQGTKAFAAAVLGGIGNIRGAMIGGLLLGLVEALVPPIPAHRHRMDRRRGLRGPGRWCWSSGRPACSASAWDVPHEPGLPPAPEAFKRALRPASPASIVLALMIGPQEGIAGGLRPRLPRVDLQAARLRLPRRRRADVPADHLLAAWSSPTSPTRVRSPCPAVSSPWWPPTNC